MTRLRPIESRFEKAALRKLCAVYESSFDRVVRTAHTVAYITRPPPRSGLLQGYDFYTDRQDPESLDLLLQRVVFHELYPAEYLSF